MAAKKKAVKRKPRVWVRWLIDWDNGVTMLTPMEAREAKRIAGDSGKAFKVRITEVVK